MQAISQSAPVLFAAAALAVNAGLYLLLFRNVKPPEEELKGDTPTKQPSDKAGNIYMK